mmetsp:Transcript_28186/g.57625  ORF Transcript_28186/g.57625 Transcript_28186/m.57625 type:complete len:202 (+) Transcript_28186:323-928(+)
MRLALCCPRISPRTFSALRLWSGSLGGISMPFGKARFGLGTGFLGMSVVMVPSLPLRPSTILWASSSTRLCLCLILLGNTLMQSTTAAPTILLMESPMCPRLEKRMVLETTMNACHSMLCCMRPWATVPSLSGRSSHISSLAGLSTFLDLLPQGVLPMMVPSLRTVNSWTTSGLGQRCSQPKFQGKLLFRQSLFLPRSLAL